MELKIGYIEEDMPFGSTCNMELEIPTECKNYEIFLTNFCSALKCNSFTDQ
jgi:hypothetical protein